MPSVRNADPVEARMADRFFDTSAFAKHYRAELGTAKVDAFLAETGSRHFISALGVFELHSVLARLVRAGEITAADFPDGSSPDLHRAKRARVAARSVRRCG
jgi:hypothetical protein